MTPVDVDVRARATSAIGVSMAISAGAGSGKTSVFCERIVEALVAGVEPSSLAAITFTEKAAGELVVRVKDSLERRLASAERAADHALGRRLSDLLGSFSTLTMTTIHSFCSELLAREAFAADAAPHLEVGIDDALRRQLLEKLAPFRRALRRDEPVIGAVVESLVGHDALAEAALTLDAYPWADDGAGSVRFDVDAARAALHVCREDITRAVSRCAAPDRDVRVQSNLAWIARVDAALVDDDALAALLGASGAPARKGGRKGDWDAGGLQAFADALEAVVSWRGAWRGAVWAEVVRRLRRDVVATFAAHKREHGQSSFQDLLTHAAVLVRTQPEARARLAARYAVILIDEVQDTDPIQAEIALALSEQSSGSLFAVGDPRQSIYRFRGADPESMTRLERAIVERGERGERDERGERGERHALTTNFRSVPGIVDWVNHTFAGLPGYVPQVAARPADDSDLDPVVLLEAGDDDASNDDDAELAAAIAWIQQRVSSPTTVRMNREARPLRARDIMIVLPSWGRADAIADALRARGIAAVVEGGGAFFQRDEVRLLVDALTAIVEPSDREATAQVLRGLCGVSLQELAAWVKAGGRLQSSAPAVMVGSVADALSMLGKLHRRVGFVPLSGLLDALLEQTHAQAVHVLLRDGEARTANVDKLLSILRDIERDAASPHEVLSSMTQLARARRGDKDVDRLDQDSDAVRVTTLFKAKGLEAPVVVLLGARRRLDSTTAIVDHARRRVLVRLGELEPRGWTEAVADEAAALREERRRWIYVAATRARDQLVLCRTPRSSLLSPDVNARGLPPAPASADAVWRPPGTTHATVRVVSMVGLAPTAASTATCVSSSAPGALDVLVDDALMGPPPTVGDPWGDRWHAQQTAATKAAARGCLRWRSPSREKASLPAVTTSPTATTTSSSAGPGVEPAPGRSARVGRVVHEVMERLDLGADVVCQRAQVATLAPLLGRRSGLSTDEAEAVAHIASRIVGHPALTMARAAPEHLREIPFSHPAGALGVVSGVIDCCFPLDDARRRWVVVDWKSTVPPPGSALRTRYEQQLSLYARALLKAFGDVEVVQTLLVGPHDELGPHRGASDVLTEVGDALSASEQAAFLALLAALPHHGVAWPVGDVDLEDDVPSHAVLGFFEHKVALGVDAASPTVFGLAVDDEAEHLAVLRARGWRLCATVAEAAAALGVVVSGGAVAAGDADEEGDRAATSVQSRDDEDDDDDDDDDDGDGDLSHVAESLGRDDDDRSADR